MAEGKCAENSEIWTPRDIASNANNWSLASDACLLRYLESFSDRLLSQASEINDNLDNLLTALDETSLNLDLARNEFASLSNTQFIESRIYEDDETVENEEELEKNDVKSTNIEEINKELLESAALKGLEVLDIYFEKVEVPHSDSEDETDFPSYVLREKDLYLHRPLPYVIGTEEWYKSPNVGLGDSSSDSEEDKVSERYSDDSDSDLEISKSTPKNVALDDTESSKDDFEESLRGPAANSTFNDTRNNTRATENVPEQNSVHVQAPLSQQAFAEQLAKKLGKVLENDESEINRKPIQKPQSNYGKLFSEEPPPLEGKTDDDDDEDDDMFASNEKKHGIFSGGDGLFDDLEDDVSFWGGKTVPEKKPEAVLPQQQNKVVPNLFDDEPDDLFANPAPVAVASNNNFKAELDKKLKKPANLFDESSSDEDLFANSKVEERKNLPAKPSAFQDDDSSSDDMFTTNDKKEQTPLKIEGKQLESSDQRKAPIGGVKVIANPNYLHDKEFNKLLKTRKQYSSDSSSDDKEEIKETKPNILAEKEEIKKNEEQPANTNKTSTSSNKVNLFDDDDDLFSSIKPASSLNEPSTTKNLFDDTSKSIFDDEVIVSSKKVNINKEISNQKMVEGKAKPQKKVLSLFDDDDDSDDIFSSNSTRKPLDVKWREENVERTHEKQEKTKKISLFDDEDDDIFSSTHLTKRNEEKTGKKLFFDEPDKQNLFSDESTADFVVKKEENIENKHDMTEEKDFAKKNVEKYEKKLLFDNSDDLLFVSKEEKVDTKHNMSKDNVPTNVNAEKVEKKLFSDEKNLFSDEKKINVVVKKEENKPGIAEDNVSIKKNVAENLFSDDSDDQNLFAGDKKINVVKKEENKPSIPEENISIKKNVAKSLFSDDSDDQNLFSGGKNTDLSEKKEEKVEGEHIQDIIKEIVSTKKNVGNKLFSNDSDDRNLFGDENKTDLIVKTEEKDERKNDVTQVKGFIKKNVERNLFSDDSDDQNLFVEEENNDLVSKKEEVVENKQELTEEKNFPKKNVEKNLLLDDSDDQNLFAEENKGDLNVKDEGIKKEDEIIEEKIRKAEEKFGRTEEITKTAKEEKIEDSKENKEELKKIEQVIQEDRKLEETKDEKPSEETSIGTKDPPKTKEENSKKKTEELPKKIDEEPKFDEQKQPPEETPGFLDDIPPIKNIFDDSTPPDDIFADITSNTSRIGSSSSKKSDQQRSLFDSSPPPEVDTWEPENYEDDIYAFDNTESVFGAQRSSIFDREPPSLVLNQSSGIVMDQGARLDSDTVNNSFYPFATSTRRFSADVFGEDFSDDSMFKKSSNAISNISGVSSPTKKEEDPSSFLDITPSGKYSDLYSEITEKDLKPRKSVTFEDDIIKKPIDADGDLNLKKEEIVKKKDESMERKATENKEKSPPGKLKHNLNINVQALLPGRPPIRSNSVRTARPATISIPAEAAERNETLSSLATPFQLPRPMMGPNFSKIPNIPSGPKPQNEEQGPPEVLQSVTKTRAKGPIRRPSTKRGREAVRKSCVDFVVTHEEEENPPESPTETPISQENPVIPDLNNQVENLQIRRHSSPESPPPLPKRPPPPLDIAKPAESTPENLPEVEETHPEKPSFVKTDDFSSPEFFQSEVDDDLFSERKLPPKSTFLTPSLFGDDDDDDFLQSVSASSTRKAESTPKTELPTPSASVRRSKSTIVKKLDNVEVTDDPLSAFDP